MRPVKIALVVLAVLVLSWASHAGAFTLPDPQTNAVLYGDAYSYSLAVLNYQAAGGNNPGDPFYVRSEPGDIKDLIVVATGASGKGLTTNFAGMNDSYATPNGTGGLPYFSTGQTALHPTAETGLLLDNSTTWNTNISALNAFLGAGNTPIFFFNNNQTNSGSALDQQLAIWGQAILVSSTGAATPEYFTFENNCPPGNVCINGSVFPTDVGGIVSGPDKNPALFNGDVAPDNNYPLGLPGSNPSLADFVLSGGAVCLDASNTLVDCSSPLAVHTVNNNLGANQAAYALIVPELNSFLASWTPSSPYDVLELDIRMGCNPAFYPGGVCPAGLELNNGYEQIFIAPSNFIPVPEPSTVLLLGAGLLGLGLFGKRKFRK